MNAMKRIIGLLALLVICSCLSNAQKIGIAPKLKPTDYSAMKQAESLTLGATQLSAKEARKTFVSNLSQDYLVVEVGVFPKGEVEISPGKFVLKEKDSASVVHVSDPQDMAKAINDKDQQGRDVAVYPVTSVTYSTGSANDPYYRDGNLNNRHGLSTDAGVVVEISSNKKDAKTSEADRKAMLAELKEKSLPQGKTKEAVAGYLYFPVKARSGVAYELDYQVSGQSVVVQLAPTAN
jgi:hypothetical protein